MKKIHKRLSLTVILFIVFIDYFSIGIVYPLFSSMLFVEKDFLVSPETSNAVRGFYLGILLAIEPIFHFLSTPILGTLSDQKGRKKVLVITLIMATVGHLFGVAAIGLNSLFFLILSRILVGIGAGNSSVVQASISDMSTRKTKAKNFGLYNMALGIGFTIGPFLGGKLTDINLIPFASYSLPFIFSAVIIFINFLLLLKFFVETHPVNKTVKFDILHGLKVVKKGFMMKDLRGVFLCSFIYVFGFSFFMEFIPVYLIERFQFTPSKIGTFYGIASGVYALSSGLLIRPIVNLFSAKSVFFYALLASGGLFFLATLIKTTIGLYLYVALVEFHIAMLFPTISTIISNKASEEVQGEILGILQAVIALGFGMSPLFSGTFVGSYPILPMLIGGVCMLLAAVIFANIHFRKRLLD